MTAYPLGPSTTGVGDGPAAFRLESRGHVFDAPPGHVVGVATLRHYGSQIGLRIGFELRGPVLRTKAQVNGLAYSVRLGAPNAQAIAEHWTREGLLPLFDTGVTVSASFEDVASGHDDVPGFAPVLSNQWLWLNLHPDLIDSIPNCIESYSIRHARITIVARAPEGLTVDEYVDALLAAGPPSARPAPGPRNPTGRYVDMPARDALLSARLYPTTCRPGGEAAARAFAAATLGP